MKKKEWSWQCNEWVQNAVHGVKLPRNLERKTQSASGRICRCQEGSLWVPLTASGASSQSLGLGLCLKQERLRNSVCVEGGISVGLGQGSGSVVMKSSCRNTPAELGGSTEALTKQHGAGAGVRLCRVRRRHRAGTCCPRPPALEVLDFAHPS